ncbi:MAG TPA: hypothetical protein VKV05_07820, partial [Terriglobales bacterium]|nr:hypothetical protein [Terriglobales bacterium]
MFIRYGSRIWVVAAAFLLAVRVGHTEQPDAAQSIEHVKNVRQLTSSDAAQGRPVRIRGVVTALSGWKNSFFLEESGYGISVDRTDDAEVHAGDAVEVTGKSGRGLFAPVIIAQQVKVIGQGAVPTAKRTAYAELAGGQGDSQWVEVRGVVHSATISESWGRQVLFLDIDTGDGRIVARVHDFPRRDFSTLVDATVRAVGVCGTDFNDKRQFVGLRLFVPDLSYIRTEEAAPRDPFAISETAIGSLFRFGLPQSLRHRVRISGVVTYQEPGSLIYVQSGNEAIAIKTSNPNRFESGTRLEAVGFVELGEYSPELRDARVRKIGRGVPPVATPTAPSKIIQLKDGFTFAPYNGLFIQLEAELVSKVESGEQQMLLLRDGDKVFQARIEEAANGIRAIDAREGSRLKLAGICVIEANQNHEPRSFHLLLRSPQDVSVLRAPWWNIRNSSWLIAFVVLVCLALLLWSLQLRRTFIRHVPDAVSGVCDARSRFLSFSQWAGLAGAGVGMAVLIGGWGCHVEMLKSILPGRVTMKANTAAAVVFLGAATWLSARGMRARAQYILMLVCSGFGAVIGLLTLIEYAFGLDLGIDQLLFRDGVTGSALFPGRMALPTAVTFVLMGCGAVLLRWRSALLGQTLLLIAGVMHLLNAVGYLYGVTNYFGMASQQGMALQTSLVCLLLCCALLWSNPNGGLMKVIASNAPGGIMAKRLLPAALLLPAVFGWLRWEGQVRGLYDTSFGLALFVSATIVVFSLLIWANAWLLNRLDVERSQAENGLRESEARYRMVLESLPQMVWTCSSDGRS